METRGPRAFGITEKPGEAAAFGIVDVQRETPETAEGRAFRFGCLQQPAQVGLQRLIPDARRGSSATAFSVRASSDL